MIEKIENGYYLDFRVGGRGTPRKRKAFKLKADALEYQHAEKQKWLENPRYKKEKRRISDLCAIWYQNHGINLKDGDRRYDLLISFSKAINNPLVAKFSARDFIQYRTDSLNDEDRKFSPNTANHYLAYLKAVFNELIRMGEWDKDNPLAAVRKLKFDEIEMCFLEPEEIKRLLDEIKKGANPDTDLVTRICLSTGARWSEAETLTKSQILDCKLNFVRTKSSRARTIPIAPELHQELVKRSIGLKKKERLFRACDGSFKHAIKRAEIVLIKGQMTHVLRHTFASHFLANGGDIMQLQRALGHSNIKTTMRYAHFSPDHLSSVATLNPLSFTRGQCVDT